MEEKEFQIEVDDLLPLRDVVFYTLRRAILTGQLKPGERLMEVHLAEKLGVSRTPIREAIRKLELEGLVTIIPRRGAEVAEITEKSLNDVLEVRKALEELSVQLACALDALGAELACERITGEEIRELKKACEDFEKAAAGNDADAIAKADVAFHDIIIRAAGNQRLEQLVNNLAEQMYRYRFVYIKEEEQRGVLLAEHREICDSIAARDVVRARNAAKQHIDNQQKAVIRQIRLEKRK